ncbi:MAG: hypothetical protein GX591_16090 [Planctomycetes bacterium]|nr:hypothetical protein [Planctomycetota bacterium]
MATKKQKEASRRNVKKAQEKWTGMSSRQRSRAQPEGRQRAKPGKGGGDYYHIEVRPSSEFQTFRTHDVGKAGGVQRVSGQRSSGSWSTQKWLISKSMAHVEGGHLVADVDDARSVLDKLASQPEHIRGDRFKAKPRRNVPEKDKPTAAQKRARTENIKKAQAARRKG